MDAPIRHQNQTRTITKNSIMEVNFNPGRVDTNPAANARISQAARRESTESAEETMSFKRTQSLEQTLKNSPQVRPEAVTRANALVNDPSYPTDEQLNRIAGLLAKNISNS